MDIRCLGQLEVVVDGSRADLGGSQQRHVLAILIGRSGAPISTDAIIDDLWRDKPPDTARKTIQGYISALRRALPDETIASSPTGYALTVDPEVIDATRFENLISKATALPTHDAEDAATEFQDALDLWRGAPFGETSDSDLLRPEAVRLEELHTVATEGLAAANVFAGRETAVAADLAVLTRRNPLRERLWALRILALYRSGRQTEALRVYDDARRTLASEAGLEPSHELRTLQQRILDQDPVLDGFGALDATPDRPGLTRHNPYKGLRAFDEADASDFYGRGALVRRLVESVARRGAPSLHVVAGPSGSGKSSLVRAGLVPALRQEGKKVEVRFPEDGLSEYLAGEGPDQVLVIDQFEELFAGDDADAAHTYLAMMAGLIEDPNPPTVVLTVRADMLDHLLSNERIAGHIEDSLLLVTPLDDHEIREIVSGPAKSVGMTVDPALVASVISGAKGHTASLPLLEYALTDLYDRTAGQTMTLEGLETAGGISGALSRRAEEALNSLDGPSQETARQVFLHLVTISDDGTSFRRRTALDELESIEGASAVIEAFSLSRMLTVDRGSSGDRTVEIAHEAILAEWPRIAGWVDEARGAMRRHRQLAEAATEWDANGRPDTLLLSGTRLVRLSDRSDGDLLLTALEDAYLTSSLRQAESQASAAQRRRRTLMAAFGAIALVAVVLAGAALLSRNNARNSADEAEASATAAETKALAGAAAIATPEDPQLGILLSLQAMLTDTSAEPTIEERLTLRSAMDADRLVSARQLTPPLEYKGSDLASDGRSMAVLSSGKLRTVDTDSWDDNWVHEDPQLDGSVGVSPDGSLVAAGAFTAPDAPYVTFLNASNGELVETVAFKDASCAAVVTPQAWSNDSRYLAVLVLADCGWENPSMRVIDTQTWEVARDIPGPWIASFAEAAPFMTLFAIGTLTDTEPRTLVYDTTTFEIVAEYGARTGDISPDGEWLASLNPASTAELYAVGTDERTDRLVGLDYFPTTYGTDFITIAASDGVDAPPALLLAVGTAGQTTNIWSIGSGDTVFTLPSGDATDLAFDPNTNLLYTVSITGLLQTWDLSGGGLAHPDQKTFPFWFDANAMRTNPLSNVGAMFHENMLTGLATYATFDTTTGALTATEISEVASPGHLAVVSALPDERLVYVAGDATRQLAGPIVVTSAAPGATIEPFAGCPGPVADWGNPFTRELTCDIGGPPFIPFNTPETSVDGTEIAASTADGELFIWDSLTLSDIVAADINEALAPESVERFLGERPPNLDAAEAFEGDKIFATVRRLDTDWILVELAMGRFVVLNRPDLDVIAGFSLFVSEWGYETSHDGSFLLLGTEGGLYRVDTDDWQPRLLAEYTETIRGISISPDNRRVMIGATDGLVHIHDTETGVLLDQIAEEWVSDGHWLDENRIVVGTGLTGIWKTLDLDIRRVALTGLDQLTRGFSPEECDLYEINPCPTIEDMRDSTKSS